MYHSCSSLLLTSSNPDPDLQMIIFFPYASSKWKCSLPLEFDLEKIQYGVGLGTWEKEL